MQKNEKRVRKPKSARKVRNAKIMGDENLVEALEKRVDIRGAKK